MLMQWGNWGWVLVGFVALLKIRIASYWLDGSYRLDRIARSWSYQLDWLDWIGWIGLDHNGWMRTHSFMHWLVTARVVWMGRMEWMRRWWDWGGTDVRSRPPERERQNRSATIGSWGVAMRWLVTANKGQMGWMDLMGRWWDRDGADECYDPPEQERHHMRRNRSATFWSWGAARYAKW